MREVWSICVGWEDRKMMAQLMKRSGTTLISGGGKMRVRKARKRKLGHEARRKREAKRRERT
jgi:hypothetical protein